MSAWRSDMAGIGMIVAGGCLLKLRSDVASGRSRSAIFRQRCRISSRTSGERFECQPSRPGPIGVVTQRWLPPNNKGGSPGKHGRSS